MARPLLLIAILLTIGAGPAAQRSGTIPLAAVDERAMAAVVHDLCPKRVALLGEATHGDGHTDAFKAALVERLVTRCHFKAVFFEASHYEFLGFSEKLRDRETVDRSMVADAIGGLWKFDREVQPLIPFLFDAARMRRLVLGGLDGQLGTLEAKYANDVMPLELTNYLQADRRRECREALRRRIYWDYPNRPYSGSDRAQILQCTAEISRSLDAVNGPDTATKADQRSMIRNIEAFTRADALEGPEFIAARDKAMYDNFAWLVRRLPKGSKVIVWSATAHIAKNGAADPAYARAGNFGSYVHHDYGARAFALGFSAASGEYRYARKNNRPLAAPPSPSLERSAVTSADDATAYLSPARLKASGRLPGAGFSHAFEDNDWAASLDGIIVFGREYPPHSTRPGY
jgi:erythromycin esterase-like protein